MTVIQTGNNVQIAVKRQTGKGAPASGAGAIGLNVVPQQGIALTKATITSNALRNDGQTTRGRHGTRKTNAAGYQVEIGVGMVDDLLEAAMRGTWTASADFDAGDFTSITTTANTIVLDSGDALTLGVRRGDMVKLTGSASSGNNGRWIRVVGASSTTITLPTASLTLDATPDTGATLTVAKTLVNGAPPVERYYTGEEYGQDIAAGLLGTDLKICKFELSIQPDANILATFTFMGLDVQAQEDSPNFTSPVYSTALPLVMADGIIRIGGVDYEVLTGFTLTWDMGGNAPSVLAPTAADVFLSNAQLSGSFTALRKDLTFFTAFSDETTVDLFVLMREKGGDTEDFLSCYIGNAVLNTNTAPPAKDGGMTETINWGSGIDDAGSDHAPTTMKWATSAA